MGNRIQGDTPVVKQADTAQQQTQGAQPQSSAAQAATPLWTSNAKEISTADSVDVATQKLRPNTEKVACPFLGAAYNNGLLNPKPNGDIDTDQVNKLMADIGFTPKASDLFVKAADDAFPDMPNAFNLFRMAETKLNHTGSTGIRDRGLDAQRIDLLTQHADANGRMYARNFATAANSFHNTVTDGQGSKLYGATIQTIEFTSLLQVLGRVDEDGERYVTVDDVRNLWLRSALPADWKKAEANSIDLVPFLGKSAGLGATRVWEAIKSFFSGLFGG